MQVKQRFHKKHLQNYTKNPPKNCRKYLQNGAKNGPKTIPNSFRKICRPNVAKITKKTTKNDTNKEPKIRKNRFGCPFFQLEKSSIFRSCFFSLFEPSGRPWTLKIKPKRCKGVQKRGSHLFTKNLDFIKKCVKNNLPWDPQNLLKP